MSENENKIEAKNQAAMQEPKVQETKFFCPTEANLKIKLRGKKQQFVGGQLVLTDAKDVAELRQMLAEKENVARLIREYDPELAKQIVERHKAKAVAAVKGGTTSATLGTLSSQREILQMQDSIAEGADPAKVGALTGIIAEDTAKLMGASDVAKTPVDDGFKAATNPKMVLGQLKAGKPNA